MADLQNMPAATTRFASRRKSPRVDVRNTLTARTPGGHPDVLAVRDLGFRGFAVETADFVRPGTRVHFEFFADGQKLFGVDSVAVHCFRRPDEPSFVSGWEFPENSGLDETIERVMHDAVGILTIE